MKRCVETGRKPKKPGADGVNECEDELDFLCSVDDLENSCFVVDDKTIDSCHVDDKIQRFPHCTDTV